MRLITVAIHTYDHAQAVRSLLEAEGIKVVLQNVNLEQPEVSSGVRVRIDEDDLPLALRILENPELFNAPSAASAVNTPLPHNVVIPVDFSDYSYRAARVGCQIAAAHHLDITLLHAYIDPHVSGNIQLTDNLTYEIAAADATEQLVSAANASMEAFVRRLKEEMKAGTLPMVRCSHVVTEGVPEEAIIAYAKDYPPFLTIMGTRSARDKEKDMIGSVTAEVLDECRFSVLSIPDDYGTGNTSPRDIIFFSNLDQEDILAMDTLYRIFPQTTAHVTIIHVAGRRQLLDKTTGRAAMALSDYCERKFTHFTFENVPINPRNAIEELERLKERHHFDLIVIPNRRKNMFTRMFNPGIAHRLLFHADLPMLVIPV